MVIDRRTTLARRCTDIVGAEHVLADEGSRDRWARTTGPAGTRPLLVVRPADALAVSRVVVAAATAGIAVHTVSLGRNWGYGDACAAYDGMLLLDLSRLDRIHDVDLELGTATIGPGVSQGKLASFLAANGSAWMADCTGAGPEASVIGNLADRGFGHSAYGDRFAHSCAYQVVLADGSVHDTGFAGLPRAKAATVYKWGVGPSLDGLFTQSNLGIITRATVWLMPRPARQTMLLFSSAEADQGGALVEGLRQLRLEGVLTSTVHLFNRMRLLGASAAFPYDCSDGTRPLELSHPELVERMCRHHQLPAWIASASLGGPAALVRPAIAQVRARLRQAGFRGRILALDPLRMGLLETAGRWWPDRLGGASFRARLANLRIMWRLLAGEPDADSVKGGGWRGRRGARGSGDPRDGGAGMIWVSPILPATARCLAEVDAIARTVLHRHGFEHQATYSLVNPRALCAVTSICFDRDDPAQRARATACHDELVDLLATAGYCPYRGAPMTQRRLWDHPVAPWDLMRRISAALDPEGLLSPGRYIPDRALARP
ncbi:MAG: FAD-binding protein [Planctomycetes bacterium]|nr:FAD-binding protein [Planctomycetota bacterium]